MFAVIEAAEEAIARARRGEGPTLIECKAFRYYGHFQGDNLSYFTEEERARNRERDPILQFRKRVLDRGLVTEDELGEIDARARAVVDEATTAAQEAPYPSPEACLTDVYVSYP